VGTKPIVLADAFIWDKYWPTAALVVNIFNTTEFKKRGKVVQLINIYQKLLA
jgi:hypothetical protein